MLTLKIQKTSKMKKLAIVLALVPALAFAQAKNVPENVKTAFTKDFPKAEKAKWEVEDGEYEVEYKVGKQEYCSKYSVAGTLLETEMELKGIEALPKAVQATLKKDFQAYKFKEVEEITLPSGEKQFEVDSKKGKEMFALVFSPTGQLIKQTKETKKDKSKM